MSGACASSYSAPTGTLPTASRGEGDASVGSLRQSGADVPVGPLRSFGHGSEDRLDDSVEIFGDLVIPESKNAVALFIQIYGAPGIAAKSQTLAMLLTVELHDEPQGMMREIRKIWADRGLPAEMSLRHFDQTQSAP